MPIDAAMAKAFGLEGDAWMRHANPWSVYTRIPIPPLMAGAIWSRGRLGRRSLLPIALVCAWTVINPRAFPPPRSLDHWASRGVLGETYWAKRKEIPIPPRHRIAPNVLGAISALGVPFVARGLVVQDGWMVMFGLAVQSAGKVWFIDRMALLYDDVALPRAPPRHRSGRPRRSGDRRAGHTPAPVPPVVR